MTTVGAGIPENSAWPVEVLGLFGDENHPGDSMTGKGIIKIEKTSFILQLIMYHSVALYSGFQNLEGILSVCEEKASSFKLCLEAQTCNPPHT